MIVYPGRNYFFCEYCSAFHFPPKSEEGVQLLDKAPAALDCPTCVSRLHRATLDGYFVFHCTQCRGVLLDQVAFRKIIKERRARATAPAAEPISLNKRELARRLDCPRCRASMSTHPYYGPGNIVIDTCASCTLIWLDFGELKRVVAAPGRDRGDYVVLLEREEEEDDD
jgi:Zn-finger nucleic acid-binding protein